MKPFLVSFVMAVCAALGSALLIKFVPLAHVAAVAGLLMIAVVFSAARAGSPPWFGVRHLSGLLLAGVAIIAHWGALIGLANTPDSSLSGLANFDVAAVTSVLAAPQSAGQTLLRLADSNPLFVGGSPVSGPLLANAWAVEAGLLTLFGFLGGQAARWRQRARI